MNEDGVREGYSDEDEKGIDEEEDDGFDMVDPDFIKREMREWNDEM